MLDPHVGGAVTENPAAHGPKHRFRKSAPTGAPYSAAGSKRDLWLSSTWGIDFVADNRQDQRCCAYICNSRTFSGAKNIIVLGHFPCLLTDNRSPSSAARDVL